MALSILMIDLLQIAMVTVAGSHSIKYAERVMVVVLVALTVWETVVILQHWNLQQLISWRPPSYSNLPVGRAMDIMAAFSIGWIPAIAEFTRYTRTKASAVWAPMIGANLALFWFALIGVMGVIASAMITHRFDLNHSDPSSVASALGLGWVAFLVLILGTVTTNAINIYVSGISIMNIRSSIKPFHAIWIASIASIVVSYAPFITGSFLKTFTLFLDYIGCIFAPLFSIMIIDFYLLKRRRYRWSDSNLPYGRYWYWNGINRVAIACWVLGAVFYLGSLRIRSFAVMTGSLYPTLIFTALFIMGWVK
jgi:purine-cytosine permease-like protein